MKYHRTFTLSPAQLKHISGARPFPAGSVAPPEEYLKSRRPATRLSDYNSGWSVLVVVVVVGRRRGGAEDRSEKLLARPDVSDWKFDIPEALAPAQAWRQVIYAGAVQNVTRCPSLSLSLSRSLGITSDTSFGEPAALFFYLGSMVYT